MNSLLGNLLLAALLIGAVLLVMRLMRLGHRSHSALLASLAGRWEGRVIDGGFFFSDRMEIRVDGVRGEISFSDETENISGWTRLRFDWVSERRLRVVPDDLVATIRRFLGGREIEFDDPPFDGRYWVESTHPVWARAVLGPAVRGDLCRLQASAAVQGPGEVRLDVGPVGIVLRVSQTLVDNAQSLGSIVELGIAILAGARSQEAPAGVMIGKVQALRGSACPVCGHAVADTDLPCPACRTPHHRDCWKYFGGCAIFGCRTRSR